MGIKILVSILRIEVRSKSVMRRRAAGLRFYKNVIERGIREIPTFVKFKLHLLNFRKMIVPL